MIDAPQHGTAPHGPRPLPLFIDLLRENTAASPGRAAAALKGLRKFQEAERPPLRSPAPAVAAAGRARLRDHGGAGPPVVFVPSLINPAEILDLEDHSLLAWLVEQSVGRVLMVDWGTPGPGDSHLDIGGHVRLLLDLLETLEEPPALVGYCLGGTLALAAAALRPATRLALIAAPWHFSGYSCASRERADAMWESARHTADGLGVLPMEVLQAGFWQLDPDRVVEKFVRFGALDPGSRAARDFVALEDWANDGPPLPLAAARELFDDLFAADLPGRGRWRVEGRRIDPAALPCPVLDIVSRTDRIVPAATSANIGQRIELNLGHVGMIVSGRAREALWQPLAAFLSGGSAPR